MAANQDTPVQDMQSFSADALRAQQLLHRVAAIMLKDNKERESLEGPSSDLMQKAIETQIRKTIENPEAAFGEAADYWLKSFQNAAKANPFFTPADSKDTRHDRQFASDKWQDDAYFRLVRDQYELNVQFVESAVNDLYADEDADQQRTVFFIRQLLDMFSPTNFLATNPDALKRASDTGGTSLIDGLENFVSDLEANDGRLVITLSDQEAFKVGENIATSKGSVVFRNELIELIQYSPKTETVHKTPLIIFPPWINKFYILDLSEKNSLIKWIVEQGFTLFVVSWANPDATFKDVGIDTYIEQGYLAAIEEAKKITGEPAVNAVGYCIAGTTLAMTLALLNKRGDKSIKSATFLTTLTDFADQGEFASFLTNDFVDGIEEEVSENGFLDSYFMSRTFSYLKPRDLVYAPAIKRYLIGEKPPVFDLLYWNGDSTRLPGRMCVEYLRWLCQENRFASSSIELLGEKLSLADVMVPVCAIACETDHIAAWKASYNGVLQMGSKSKTFIVSESGHIAGIVNPPEKKKYGHYTNPKMIGDVNSWFDAADFNEGSWWPRWGKWLAAKSGAQIEAREPETDRMGTVVPAPGEYVLSHTK